MGILETIQSAGDLNNYSIVTPAMGKIWFFAKVIFWFAAFVFGGIAAWKFWFQYNVPVKIHQKTGQKGEVERSDRAKILVDEQNKRKLVLLKIKRDRKVKLTCPVPPDSFKVLIGRREGYHLWLDDNYQLHPMEKETLVDKKGAHTIFHIRPQERDAWARMEDKLLLAKYKRREKWQEIMPYVAYFGTGIIVFLVWFFAVKQLGAGLADLAVSFKQVASECTKLG